MTDRELLELYKQGKLEENKKHEVESDIERQEAISDYLFDRDAVDNDIFSDDKNLDDAESENDFVKMINSSIRKAFVKMGMTILVIAVAVMLFVVFALPNVVSQFYYNPGRDIGSETNRMSLDMSAYTELRIPGYYRNNVMVSDEGYGDYDINIVQNMSYTGNFTNVSGKVEKGKLKLYDVNTLRKPSGNVFAWFQATCDSTKSLSEIEKTGWEPVSSAGDKETADEKINNLFENTNYLAYVTLDKMMTYDELMSFTDSDGYTYAQWCAVCTRNGINDGTEYFTVENLGFNCALSISSSMVWDEEKYPNLIVWNCPFDENAGGYNDVSSVDENIKDTEYMKTHFVSLLRYMADRKQFLKLMDEEADVYSSAADYVEKNGLMVYGFAFVGDKERIQEVNARDEVYQIYTQEMR